MVMLMEADSKSSAGDFAGALALCDACSHETDGTDGFPYVMKANIYQVDSCTIACCDCHYLAIRSCP